jgi:hypothetical protein
MVEKTQIRWYKKICKRLNLIIVASNKPEALGKEEVKPGNLLLLPNG